MNRPSRTTPPERLEGELVRRIEQVEALGRVAHVLAGAEDAARTMEFVAAEGMRVFGAQRAAVFLMERPPDVLQCMVARGLSDKYLVMIREHFADLPSAEFVWRGLPWFSVDAREEQHVHLREAAREEGFAAVAVLPLVYAGRTMGALVFYHNGSYRYTADERRLAVAFADQAALAIGKSRLLDQVSRVKREWQQAFDGCGNGLALVEQNGEVVRANRFIADLVGLPVTELPGFDIRAAFRAWPKPEHDPLLQAVAQQARVSALLDGRSGRSFVLTATPRPEGGLVVALDDLTEYLRLEARHTRVVNTAHDAIVIADAHGKVSFTNPAAETFFGLGTDRLRGMALTALLPEARPAGPAPEGRRRFVAMVRGGGVSRIADVSVAPLEEGGTGIGTVAVVRDVTEEQEALQALQRSEERFRALFDRAPLAIFATTPQGGFLSVNRSGLTLLGVERLGGDARFEEFIVPAELPRFEQAMGESFRGAAREVTFHLRRPDGVVRQVAAISVAVEEKAGQPVLLTIARDVTDELELRQRLTHSEKMGALGTLVSGVAHELNNPLAGIAALVQACLHDPAVDEQTGKILETVRREAMRAAKIVNDLLAFARLRPIEPVATDLTVLVNEALEASPSLRDGQVQWVFDLAGDTTTLADAGQVRQVVTNLLTNAVQAMRDREVREARVRTWATEPLVGFEVTDTGPGIAPEALSRIFEPFYTTKAAGEGTGLGLSISHGIIRAHGGEIRGENRPEGGARFWFELPRDTTRLTGATDG